MEFERVYRSIKEDIRKNTTYQERNGIFELGLITAWESGRINRDTFFKHLISCLENGALPKLNFKGGHIMPFEDIYKNKAKYIYKYGTLNYLAQRQGILNQDLDIDLFRNDKAILTCSVTGLKTIFTIDMDKYKENLTYNKKVPHGLL